MAPRYVAVCGASQAGTGELAAAREVGRLLAEAGAVVISGGLDRGVMAAASQAAAEAGGTVVGVLPGEDRTAANQYVTVALATGLGEARNAVIVTAADSVIAIGGGWGTLSEIAFARRLGRPVIGLETWDLKGLETVSSAAEAVRRALGA
ncbi:MAG TPA: TIGR00725 family protein [Candidatus Acidoferrales bacterium]|nr:TIGR00725 family protein [Candidatus Acidoferrales bacterium]